MFGIGLPEILVVIIISLLVFDIKSLPKLGRFLGKASKEFKKAKRSLTEDSDDYLAG